MYDGFISYSHAADDLLAPRLQAGLQRFAKPWWKRRALRIFRDESSLSANPHLWSSIVEALNQSEWFVLLLSPDAAQSEWVNQEIEHWTINKDPSRILPVVTDGDFGWVDEDVAGSSVPSVLQGVFSEEPRWVDLRFAKGEEQLDLKNPAFSDAVADIASAIRGIPKDELASEEVRQHRRTVRTAWTAGVTLLAMAVVAVVFGIQSANNAAVAKSRELAAAAVSIQADNPELAMMLALESIEAAPKGSEASATGVIALRQALLDNRVAKRFHLDAGPKFAKISPDGSTVFVSFTNDQRLIAIDAVTERELWTYGPTDPDDVFHHVSMSPDGEMVTLSILIEGPSANTSRVIVFEATTGDVLATLTPGPCPWTWTAANGFSPDGRYLAISTGEESCVGMAPNAAWVSVLDTNTWEEVQRITLDTVGQAIGTSFSSDSSRVLIYDFNNQTGAAAEVRTFPGLELIATLPAASHGSLSPDGTMAAVNDRFQPEDRRVQLWDVDRGAHVESLDAVDDFLTYEALSFSPNGANLAVLTQSGNYLFDGSDGRLVSRLGRTDFALTHSFTRDEQLLLTVSADDTILWNAGEVTANSGSPLATEEVNSVWIDPNLGLNGPELAVITFIEDAVTLATPESGYSTAVNLVHPTTGGVSEAFLGSGDQIPDGRFVIRRIEAVETSGGADRAIGPTVVWDPQTTDVLELTHCSELESILLAEIESDCLVHQPPLASRDGTILGAQSQVPSMTPASIHLWDASTLDLLHEVETAPEQYLAHVGPDWLALFNAAQSEVTIVDFRGDILAEFGGEGFQDTEESPDGSLLYLRGGGGVVVAYDTTTWVRTVRWTAHEGQIRGLSFSPDNQKLVTTGNDGFVNVWDVSAIRDLEAGVPPPLLDRIPTPVASDAAWLDNENLMLFLREGAKQMTVSLNQDHLIREAKTRLTRGFTLAECAIYQIAPCPTTLEAMQED